jgi:hypothetical protein
LQYRSETADKHHGRKLPDGSIQWGGFPVDVFYYVDSLEEADGIGFLCPKCFDENKGAVGTHGLHIYFKFKGRKVPDRIGLNGEGKTVRWAVSGTGLDDLVLTPSILLLYRCAWHGFVGSSGIPPGHAG